jgi:hypothetical protein
MADAILEALTLAALATDTVLGIDECLTSTAVLLFRTS